jgi:hypothetical protein
MIARILNNEFGGLFEENFIEKNQEKKINGAFVSEWQLTDVLPSENLLKPQWNGTEWIEGATTEEIQTIQNQKKHEIYLKIFQVVNNLTTSALSRATNKLGLGLSRIELENLKSEYKSVYEVAKYFIDNDNILNQIIFDNLDFEQENDFTGDILNQVANQLQISTAGISRIQIYCKIIIKKYELGELMLNEFNSFIRTFRSKMITFLDKNDFHKIESGFNLSLSITNQTENSQLYTIFLTFNNL